MVGITLYHGTSKEHLGSLLEKGIMPWGLLKKHNWEFEEDFYGLFVPKKDCVYLGYLEKAIRYAEFVKNGIVLKVKVDISKLQADEDSFKTNWKDSLKFNGTCAHLGIIFPNQIKDIIKL